MKKKKKWREIRSAVTMMLVMVAMLSTATYAWFTLTSSPTVTGMQMTAVSSGGLVVSNTTNENDFKSAITITDGAVKTLVPVTPVEGATESGFCLPVYEGGYVADLEEDILVGTNDLENRVAVYTYYIKSQEGEVNVGIITGDAGQGNPATVTNDVANATGTFIRPKTDGTDTALGDASDAIRIGLVIYDDTTTEPGSIKDIIILEPNNDGTYNGVGTYAPVKTDQSGNPLVAYDSVNFATDVSFQTDGTITSANPTDTYTSQALFQVGTSAKKVVMYVWIEGTDAQCIDQIMADQLEAQIQFTIIPANN